MKKTKSLLVAVSVIVLCANVRAEVCEEGVQATKKQKYEIALTKFTNKDKKNDKKCLMGMSFLNYFGYGVPQNYEQAFMYAHKSAQLGFAEAQGFLSAMYAEGQGTQKNLVKAHMWGNVASARGITFATQVRDSVTQRMSAEEIKEAQALAYACSQKNYEQCE